MSNRIPRMASLTGEKMRRSRLLRGCFFTTTWVLGFLTTVVTKALRTRVPFNCCGRLDSCVMKMVCQHSYLSLTPVRAVMTVASRTRQDKVSTKGLGTTASCLRVRGHHRAPRNLFGPLALRRSESEDATY